MKQVMIYGMGFLILGFLVRFQIWEYAILLVPLWFLSPLFCLKRMFEMQNILIDAAGFMFFLGVPVAVCIAHWKKPEWFTPFLPKYLFWSTGLSLLCWIVIAGSMAVSIHFFYHYPDNGFAIVCAYALGWLYIWFFAIPIFTLYALLLSAIFLCKNCMGK